MDFGVVLQTNPPASRTVELARLAETHGFSHVWTFDSHLLWQEPFVIYSAILAATRKVMVGPMVTNPATRDWTVIASLFATLNEMYGNRTICGIGRGDSAVRTLHGKPSNLATLRESVHVIRELANDRSVEVNGAKVHFPWSRGSTLDIWVAAYGPLALKLTGEVGDGFILQLADPDIAAWTIKVVRDAAEQAGRDPDAVKFCVAAPDVHRRRPRSTCASSAAGSAAWSATTSRTSSPGTAPTRPCRRPSPTTSPAGRATTTTSTAARGTPTPRSCPTRSSSGSASSAAPRSTSSGSRPCASLGVTQFAGYLQHDNKEETMRVYGEHVIPALATPVVATA